MRERDSRGNNCALLGDGSNPAKDHLHVRRTTAQREKVARSKEAGEELKRNDVARKGETGK